MEKIGGVACAGVHNMLLHGSGIAFCHKLHVTINKVKLTSQAIATPDNVDSPPDVMQPVLLEIQSFMVHGIAANLMWDN